MATILSHAVAACALGQGQPAAYRRDWRFWYMTSLCAMLPDIDVVSFKFGVPYESMWGHRGITHSLFFAAFVGCLAAARFKPDWRRDGWRLALFFFVATASHGVLDAFTNGGRGVAFFAPFDRTRYFFPWTPIQVSPIGARFFLSGRGLEVLASELRWIWLPALVLSALIRYFRAIGIPIRKS